MILNEVMPLQFQSQFYFVYRGVISNYDELEAKRSYKVS
jgi:hypothetical protein